MVRFKKDINNIFEKGSHLKRRTVVDYPQAFGATPQQLLQRLAARGMERHRNIAPSIEKVRNGREKYL